MSSTLACLGLGVADEAAMADLVELVALKSRVVATAGDLEARRWVDPSGASITLALRSGSILDLVPSWAAAERDDAQLSGLAAYGACVSADVLQDGELATRVAADLAQVLVSGTGEEVVPAAVTALGVDVSVHADADAFAASPASLLGEPREGVEPVRFAPESLLPYGLFGDAEAAEPTAFVAGTVLESETRTNALTGVRFHTARLRTIGFTGTLCLDVDEHPELPPPGSVVAGACYLVLDVPALENTPDPKRRSLFRWR